MCEHTGSKWLYTLGGLGLGVVLMVGWIICSMWNWPGYGMPVFNDFRHGYRSGAMGAPSMMVGSLQGKTGDAFDAAFLSAMIAHHQDAVDMATLAATKAQHQEVKDLAKSIATSQAKEISTMKAWQAKWGYTK